LNLGKEFGPLQFFKPENSPEIRLVLAVPNKLKTLSIQPPLKTLNIPKIIKNLKDLQDR